MRLTTVEVSLHNPEKPAECRAVNLLVDTGAMCSIVPQHILDDLGIKPRWRRQFSSADGQRIERDASGALYRIGEYEGHALVIFGEEGDHPILGVTALEAMGLQLDPLTHEVKPIELLLL